MSDRALEMARQRAQQEDDAEDAPVSKSYHSSAPVRPSPTDWGQIRGPSDPNSDGSIAIVSRPFEVDTSFDDGGFGSDNHPGNDPVKKLLHKPRKELTPEESELLFEYLAMKERTRSEERDAVALEHERFNLTKKKTVFDMVKKFAVGFGVLAALGFTLLVVLLIWVSIKKTDFTDTSVIASILTTFASFFQILANL